MSDDDRNNDRNNDNVLLRLPPRNWKEFPGQSHEGTITEGLCIEVEVMEFPGTYVEFRCVCPVPLTREMIGKKVVGDLGAGGFYVRVLCVMEGVEVLS